MLLQLLFTTILINYLIHVSFCNPQNRNKTRPNHLHKQSIVVFFYNIIPNCGTFLPPISNEERHQGHRIHVMKVAVDCYSPKTRLSVSPRFVIIVPSSGKMLPMCIVIQSWFVLILSQDSLVSIVFPLTEMINSVCNSRVHVLLSNSRF